MAITPLAQANGSKAEVKLKVKVVSPVSVTTSFVWPVGYRMALLHGRLDDMGTASTVNVYFDWGKTTDCVHSTKAKRMTHTGRFSAVLNGLTPDTTYYFRAVAESEGIRYYGSDEPFTFSTWKHWWWP